MTNSKLEKLVNVSCPLDKAYKQLVPESIQTASKIQRQRLKDESLRREWFITGDGCVYNIENNQAVIYLTNTALNPVLKWHSIADAAEQIRESGNFQFESYDFWLIQREAEKKTGKAERYVLSDLGLRRYDREWSFFEIDTKKFDKLNKSQRALAEQVHGKGRQFVRVMHELENSGNDWTRVFLLDTNYVKIIAKDRPVARVGRLDIYNYNSYFLAGNKIIDWGKYYVRGLLRSK